MKMIAAWHIRLLPRLESLLALHPSRRHNSLVPLLLESWQIRLLPRRGTPLESLLLFPLTLLQRRLRHHLQIRRQRSLLKFRLPHCCQVPHRNLRTPRLANLVLLPAPIRVVARRRFPLKVQAWLHRQPRRNRLHLALLQAKAPHYNRLCNLHKLLQNLEQTHLLIRLRQALRQRSLKARTRLLSLLEDHQQAQAIVRLPNPQLRGARNQVSSRANRPLRSQVLSHLQVQLLKLRSQQL